MSVFEIVMLLCFGAAWLASIYKSFKSRKNNGKSVMFLIILLLGYLSGILNKLGRKIWSKKRTSKQH